MGPYLKYQEQPTKVDVGPIRVNGVDSQQVISSIPTNFISGQNVSGGKFTIGSFLTRHSSGFGFILADRSSALTNAIGISTQGSPNSLPEIIQISGLFCMNDWSNILGSKYLQPLGNYYLGNNGQIIPNAPLSGISQFVGYAISRITLLLDIQPAIQIPTPIPSNISFGHGPPVLPLPTDPHIYFDIDTGGQYNYANGAIIN